MFCKVAYSHTFTRSEVRFFIAIKFPAECNSERILAKSLAVSWVSQPYRLCPK